jgi:hypothetical protein
MGFVKGCLVEWFGTGTVMGEGDRFRTGAGESVFRGGSGLLCSIFETGLSSIFTAKSIG